MPLIFTILLMIGPSVKKVPFIWVVFKRYICKPTEFISVGHMEGKPTESLLYYSPVNSGYIEQMPFPRQAIAR